MYKKLVLDNYTFDYYEHDAIVVGSGAAGFSCADKLWESGKKDVVMVTEGRKHGTSRNTGSDKQTYYKLTLAGGELDSIKDLADDLFSGGAMDGYHAVIEAAMSVPCMLRLVDKGVSFPRDSFGQFVGYKTDHDPKHRATSVGPYTSRVITECLEKSVEEKKIPIYDRVQVIRILTQENQIWGLFCLNLNKMHSESERYVVFRCNNLVMATGGPGKLFENSVYPTSQHGANGLLFECGANGKNLTEWQFGLGSIKPKWNVSGSYFQAIPSVYSIDSEGREFNYLGNYFRDIYTLCNNIFLKGYQWPFDVCKIGGSYSSSIIDVLTWLEIKKGRKVFLDFRRNPGDTQINLDSLSKEVIEYYHSRKAWKTTPIQRLSLLNQPAIDFYHIHGVDVTAEPLEISLCAQHNNGGIDVNEWWMTSIEGLFAIGEAAGTHGVYRPGGAALNAGQVGSLRAAASIANNKFQNRMGFSKVIMDQIRPLIDMADSALSKGESTIDKYSSELRQIMAFACTILRSNKDILEGISRVEEIYKQFSRIVGIETPNQLGSVFRLREQVICQFGYMTAMQNYSEELGKSRGSAIYLEDFPVEEDALLREITLADYTDELTANKVQIVNIICGEDLSASVNWRNVKPIPDINTIFETVWEENRLKPSTEQAI